MEVKASSPQFSIPLRVYYEDTDAGGVVYYANYLKYLERCRTEWLRSLGVDQSELLRDTGAVFVVRHVNIDYLKPARLDDAITVTLHIEQMSKVKISFRQSVVRARAASDLPPEVLISGTVQIVCVNSALMKVTPIPDFLQRKLESCL